MSFNLDDFARQTTVFKNGISVGQWTIVAVIFALFGVWSKPVKSKCRLWIQSQQSMLKRLFVVPRHRPVRDEKRPEKYNCHYSCRRSTNVEDFYRVLSGLKLHPPGREPIQ
jgi:hypothetical protein